MSRFGWNALLEVLEDRSVPAVYYVAATGADGADGSQDSPWRTLQRAADAVRAGDAVYVQSGTYAGFDLRTDGTANDPISFLADPGVVINADNPRTPDGINLEGADYILIDGFTVRGATRAGIRSVTNRHVSITNNVADDNGRWGIFTGFSDDILIENNVASHSHDEHGVYVSNSGDRPIIRNNIVFGNQACGIHMNGDLSQGGDGIISAALVEGNIIHDNGIGGGSAINADGVRSSTFRNNLLYNNHASGISLFQIDGGSGSANNTVVNNTILQASDGRWALNITDGSTGNYIANNILLSDHSYRGSISISADSLAGFASDNNVAIDRFTLDDGDTVISLASWRAATGQDSHSLFAGAEALFLNPAANDYRLSSTSPAIDAGTSLRAPGFDLTGRVRPTGEAVDIGAYEYAAQEVNLPPILADDHAETDEDSPIVVRVLANDSDPEGDWLSAQVAVEPAHGTVETMPDGTMRYAPFVNFFGADQFVYRADDGRGHVSFATVFLTVRSVNDAPIARNDTTDVATGAIATVTVLANDSDEDGDALRVLSVNQGAHGLVRVESDGRIFYSPAAGFSGVDQFQYIITDDHGGQSTATVFVTVRATTTASAAIEADPLFPGRSVLVVRGSNGQDVIEIVPTRSGGKINARINGKSTGEFVLNSFDRIAVYGLGGNDRIEIHPSIKKSSLLDGGPGNDTLRGGKGYDILLGREGNDRIFGGGGRDLLLAGTGSDRLWGGANCGRDSGDILFGGTTLYDDRESALQQVLAEWSSARSFGDRVQRLRTGAGGLPIINNTTVLKDAYVDLLFGGPGRDWLLPEKAPRGKKS